jgi:glyoxylase-like metal-dependent hydrolase (beta-lactamase superfamily II)
VSLTDERPEEPTTTEVVAPGVVRVPQRTPTLPPATRTNAWLVRGRAGWWVVDPAAADAGECGVLSEAMSDAERRSGVPIRGAILTHHHPDHIGGLGWWADTVGLPVVAERRTVALVSGAAQRDDLDAAATLAWDVVDGDATVDGLELLFTPGHAPGHLAIWTGEGHEGLAPRVLVAGDLVSGIGTIIVAPPRGNMADYLASLRRALALRPDLLLPSHGPGTTDAVGRLEAYIAHRLVREQKVLDALDPMEPRSLEEVTRRAYDDTPEAFRGFATLAAQAHLEKLVTERRAAPTGDGYLLASIAPAE